LVELLVVIAILAVLIALLVPSLRQTTRAGRMAREMSAARQLAIAYSAYTYDHDGVLMPGYWPNLPAFDQNGQPITQVPVPWRYPWRLAPYLDYNLKGLYQDDRVIELLSNQALHTYLISFFPSLGMNTFFIGGDTTVATAYQQTQGEFWRKRLSQVRRPAELILFASARSDESWPGAPGPMLIEGHYRVIPPYLTNRNGSDVFNEHAPPAEFGFVSLRHPGRSAVVGMFDGSAGIFNENQIQDMRHWADQATKPDWTLGSP
jgi:type II secretory pathway pseudopilin PulG